ncbi:hypothetical protein AB1N83_005696 [Pleurotus pulmonarius]
MIDVVPQPQVPPHITKKVIINLVGLCQAFPYVSHDDVGLWNGTLWTTSVIRTANNHIGTKWQRSAIGTCYERCRIHWFGLRSNRNINGSPGIKLVPITPFPFPRCRQTLLCADNVSSRSLTDTLNGPLSS